MTKGRVEAFSDGVLAILITIMVLELRPPEQDRIEAFRPLVPVFLSYVLSFVYLGIYWNNHHHLFQATKRIAGSVLWANLHLLFWLSLVPFVTAWMGNAGFGSLSVAMYGVVMLMASVAYFILVHALLRHHEEDSKLRTAIGDDRKGKASMLVYAASVPAAFVHPLIACLAFIAMAIVWLVPDRRIEKSCDP